MPFDEVASAGPELQRILAHTGNRGIFSAEFKQDERDGTLRILEINTRPWVYIEFARVCGVNMVDLFVRDALGLAVPERRVTRTGIACVDLEADLRAIRDMPAASRPRWSETLRQWLFGFKLLFSLRDPGPALRVLAIHLQHAVRH